MSIDKTGLKSKLIAKPLLIHLDNAHPLLHLGNSLDWESLSDLVLTDLQSSTAKRKWWLGRPLCLRIHLGAYLLQQLFNLTDRQTEYGIKDNAAYQLFCGCTIVKKWHCPDHTKLEAFRSRLSPKTQAALANAISCQAVNLGFAEPSHVDIDSTIQEANMTYPSDSNLLCKLGKLAKVAADYMNDKLWEFSRKPMKVNLKAIKRIARRYFFLKKTVTKEEKGLKLKALLDYVSGEIRLIIDNARCMGETFIEEMPKSVKRTFILLIQKAKKYLADVRQFIESGNMVPDKLLSFHLNEVKCFTKNKAGKKYQFGRAFQLGRIKGNFLFVEKCTDVVMSDKKAITRLLETHANLFNSGKIISLAADKGYYSSANEKSAVKHGVKEIGIQRPGNIKKKRLEPLSEYREQQLIDRRAGIEPLIGHAKQQGQLGHSRMKSDRTIESSGYTAVLGFNLRQLIRYKKGKISLEST